MGIILTLLYTLVIIVQLAPSQKAVATKHTNVAGRSEVLDIFVSQELYVAMCVINLRMEMPPFTPCLT